MLGQAEKFEIDRYLRERPLCRVDRAFPMEKTGIASQKDRTRFFFKIQDGCNKFCSYCIVPVARGRGAVEACRGRGSDHGGPMEEGR